MKLGEVDKNGRREPVKIENSELELDFDSLIYAIGQQVVLDFGGNIEIYKNYETNYENIFVGGDALRGASNLINAIADGYKVAYKIVGKVNLKRKVNLSPLEERQIDARAIRIKQAKRNYGVNVKKTFLFERLNFNLFIETLSDEEARKESERCLQCDIFCNICTTVCPNRSNIFYETDFVSFPIQKAIKTDTNDIKIICIGEKEIEQKYQIINISDFCNECGNCTTFCPTSGKPYDDKPKFHLTKESFDLSQKGFYFKNKNKMLIKNDGIISELVNTCNEFVYNNEDIKIVFNEFEVANMQFKNTYLKEFDILPITEYIFLYKKIRDKIFSII
jgi:putative selenate reductase